MINIRCPLNTLLGYGAASWGIINELHNRNVDYTLFPIGNPYITSGDPSILEGHVKRLYNPLESCLTIWHEHDLITNFLGKGKHVAYPFFELNKMDELRVRNLNAADAIIVASRWGKNILEENNIKSELFVAPLGVDREIFFPRESTDEPYRFFNVGKIEYRKGTFLLPDLFKKAFPGQENVELYIFCDSILQKCKEQTAKFIDDLNKNNPDPRIKVIQGGFPLDLDLADFIRQMDCGVFPTRAEGFGLPILQSLSCGKTVITTNYSAHTEFCNKENSFLVEIDSLEPAKDGVWFNGFGEWAKLGVNQIDDFVDRMRHAYKNNLRYNQEGINTSKDFSWTNCTTKVLAAFES